MLETRFWMPNRLSRSSAGGSDKQTSCLNQNPKWGGEKHSAHTLNADEWKQDESFSFPFFSIFCLTQPATGSCDILVTFIGFFFLFIYFNVRFISEAESPQIQPGIQICLQAFRQHAGNSLPTISRAQLFQTNNLYTCQNLEYKSSFIYLFNCCWNGSLNQTCDVLLFSLFFFSVCLVFLKFFYCKILVEEKKKSHTTSISSAVHYCTVFDDCYVPVWILTGITPGVAQEYLPFPSWSVVMSLLVTYSVLICSAERSLLAQDTPAAAL